MNRAADFYRLCFDAFADAKHTVILSVGRQTQVEELGQAPPNFIVRQYVPQLEALRHAKVFITHGGMNSTSEGLLFGVPLVVQPRRRSGRPARAGDGGVPLAGGPQRPASRPLPVRSGRSRAAGRRARRSGGGQGGGLGGPAKRVGSTPAPTFA